MCFVLRCCCSCFGSIILPAFHHLIQGCVQRGSDRCQKRCPTLKLKRISWTPPPPPPPPSLLQSPVCRLVQGETTQCCWHRQSSSWRKGGAWAEEVCEAASLVWILGYYCLQHHGASSSLPSCPHWLRALLLLIQRTHFCLPTAPKDEDE